MLALGLEGLPAQWSDTMLTEFTWIVPMLFEEEPLVLPVEVPVDELAVALSPVLLAEAEGSEPAVCPAPPEFPVLALAGFSEPVICTSCPMWLLS